MQVGSSEIFTDIVGEIMKEGVGCIIATGDLVEEGKRNYCFRALTAIVRMGVNNHLISFKKYKDTATEGKS